jgi:hypothetical protein
MYDPQEKRMVPMSEELKAKFASGDDNLTPAERIQRDWTRFEEGEVIQVKGIAMRVHEIGESRLVLKFK